MNAAEVALEHGCGWGCVDCSQAGNICEADMVLTTETKISSYYSNVLLKQKIL